MIALEPKLLVAAANALIGVREEGGDNRGAMVELMLRGVGQPAGQPWCAAFVHHCGYWAHFDPVAQSSSWPLPATASCWELGQFALVRRILRTDAQVGDVFLQYSPTLRRFHHTGIVVSVNGRYPTTGASLVWACTTVEGNTNSDGSPNGTQTLRKARRLSTAAGDRFIRWAELDWQQRAA